MPTRDETRQAILGQLGTHTTALEWAHPRAAQQFADTVLELAERLRLTETVPVHPTRPAATDQTREAAKAVVAEAVRESKVKGGRA